MGIVVRARLRIALTFLYFLAWCVAASFLIPFWPLTFLGVVLLGYSGLFLLVIWRALEKNPPNVVDDELVEHHISREDLPELWATVDRLCAAANIKPVDAILLDPSVNAAASPLYPWLPHSKGNRLLLGLPLLVSLNRQSMDSVLSHEVAHLADRNLHAVAHIHHWVESLNLFVYRISTRHMLRKSRILNGLARKVCASTDALTVLSASTSVQCELHADKFSTQFTTQEACVRAHLFISLMKWRYTTLSEDWIDRTAMRSEIMPTEPYNDLLVEIREKPDAMEIRRLQNTIKVTLPSVYDSHPLDRDRLWNNGWDGEIPVDVATVADTYCSIDHAFAKAAADRWNSLLTKANEEHWKSARQRVDEAHTLMEKTSGLSEEAPESDVVEYLRALQKVRRSDEVMLLADRYEGVLTSDAFRSIRAWSLVECERFDEALELSLELVQTAQDLDIRWLEFRRLVFAQFSGHHADYPFLVALQDELTHQTNSHNYHVSNLSESELWLELDLEPKIETELQAILANQTNLGHTWVCQRMAGHYPPVKQLVLIVKPTLFTSSSDIVADVVRGLSEFPLPAYIHAEKFVSKSIRRKVQQVYKRPWLERTLF